MKYVTTIRDTIINSSFDVYFKCIEKDNGSFQNLLFKRMSAKEYERGQKQATFHDKEKEIERVGTQVYVELSDLYIDERVASENEIFQQIHAMCDDEEWIATGHTLSSSKRDGK